MSRWPPVPQALTGCLDVRFYLTWEMPNTLLERVQLLFGLSLRTFQMRCDLGLGINIAMPIIACVAVVS